MAAEEKKLTDTANAVMTTVKDDPAPANSNVAQAGAGLSYATANEAEKKRMDEIIAGIDLAKPESVVNLGSQERQKLAKLADDVLDSVQPGPKLAFANAMKELISVVQANSLDDLKNRANNSAKSMKKWWHSLTGKDDSIAMNQKKIDTFMTDVASSRKTIKEMADKLGEQEIKLKQNFQNIIDLGAAVTEAAADLRIVRAASAEYIRRVNAGEITTLTDLQNEATKTGRSDATQKLQEAKAAWNCLQEVDKDLLGSIGTYDTTIATMAFTKEANMRNRMKTQEILTQQVADWKIGLATFETIMIENQANALITDAKQLTANSIKQRTDVFTALIDAMAKDAGSGTIDLKQIIASQDTIVGKLQDYSTTVDAQYKELAAEKVEFEKKTVDFRAKLNKVYSSGSIMGSTPGAAKPAAGPSP